METWKLMWSCGVQSMCARRIGRSAMITHLYSSNCYQSQRYILPGQYIICFVDPNPDIYGQLNQARMPRPVPLREGKNRRWEGARGKGERRLGLSGMLTIATTGRHLADKILRDSTLILSPPSILRFPISIFPSPEPYVPQGFFLHMLPSVQIGNGFR